MAYCLEVLMVKLFCLKFNSSRRVVRSYRRKVLYSLIFRVWIEGYLEIIISSYLNFIDPYYDTWGEILSIALSVISMVT